MASHHEPRIVVFGATGYTGRLVAGALVRDGARPVLAGRSAPKLSVLTAELGDLETAVADVGDPRSVRALVAAGDVLVSTVGPFRKYGEPAVRAAVEAGAHYLDSTGEPPFIRRVFERWDGPARAAQVGLLTAFGYDWVPGNLAAVLALERAGPGAVAVHVGYFMTGSASRDGMSGGTAASLGGVLLEPGFAWHGGRLVTERGAARVRGFHVGGRLRQGFAVGASEHFTLPRWRPSVAEVDVYLGWLGPASRGMQAFSAVGALARRVPGVQSGAEGLLDRFLKGSTGGPDAAARSRSASLVVAEARTANGEILASSTLRGPNPYTYTADILAWAARRALEHGLEDVGALGPAQAFGLEALTEGNRAAGMVEAR